MMNTQWESFLKDRGATVADGRVRHFGDETAECAAVVHESVLTDLSHYGVITADGADAAGFLQNQLTNDVRTLEGGAGQLSGYCTPKGRLLAVFRLFTDEDRYYLRMPAEIVDPLLKRLQMFVLMSNVELASQDDTLQRIGVAGPGAAAALDKHFGTRPQTEDGVIRRDDCLLARVPGEHRYEIYGPAEHLSAVWKDLESDLRPVGADAWPLLDILNGIPTVYAATVETFIPQAVNLEVINGVSFKKGCFPGQEVVARMHYRGQSKRRMARFSYPGDTPPVPGAPVISTDTEKAREVGEIVDARPHPDGGCQGLAVLPTSGRDQTLAPENDPGNPLKLLDLPYSFGE